MKKEALKARNLLLTLISTLFAVGVLGTTNVCEVQAAPTAPATPSSVTATASGQIVIYVKWKLVKGAQGYLICRDGKRIIRTSSKATSFKQSGLTPNKRYGFTVRAFKTYNQKQWYNKKTKKWQTSMPRKSIRGSSRTVKAYVYSKPSPMRYATTTSFQQPVSSLNYSWGIYFDKKGNYWGIDLKWNKTTGAEKYYVYNGTGKRISTTLDTGEYGIRVGTGSSYTFYVTAVNKYGKESTRKRIVVPARTTSTITPSAVSKLTYSWDLYGDSNGGSYWGVDLNWDKVTGASKYYIYSGDTKIATSSVNYLFDIRVDTSVSNTFSVASVGENGKTSARKTVVVPARETAKKYNYRIKYFNQPYSGVVTGVFIETDNPDPDSFEIQYYKTNGIRYQGAHNTHVLGADYFDLPYSKEAINTGIHKVEGGYVRTCSFDDPGEYIVKVVQYEKDGNNNYSSRYSPIVLDKSLGRITVMNYMSEFNKWMDNIINTATTPEMTQKQKMQAISDYLYATTKYFKNYDATSGGWKYFHVITETGIPDIVSGEWDSISSPKALVQFGEKIGYPVIPLYGEYEYGTAEYNKYHATVKSTQDGTLYSFCKPRSSNTVPSVHSRDDVPKINCLTYAKYYDCY